MKIKWLGHSCFLLTADNGTKVLTDPYDPYIGYKLPPVEADIVTTSHMHNDHNNIRGVKGNFRHISETGTFDLNGVRITGIPTFHDNEGGSRRGGNIVYIFEMDSLRICHCGDLGHVPTKELADRIGRVDVLLVPTGGIFTIDAAGAAETVRILKPSAAIPMHYKTSLLTFKLDGVDKFLASAGGVKSEKHEIEVKADNLAALPKVLVLSL